MNTNQETWDELHIARDRILKLEKELEKVKGELAKFTDDRHVMVDYKEFRKTCDEYEQQLATLRSEQAKERTSDES